MSLAISKATRSAAIATIAIITTLLYHYYQLLTSNSSNHAVQKATLPLHLAATDVISPWLTSLLRCAKQNNVLRPLSGAIGSALSITAVYPLETVRTRLQVGVAGCDNTDKKWGANGKGIDVDGNESNFVRIIRNYFTSSSFLHRIYRIYKTEGIVNGLYKGWYSLVVTTMILNFVYFYWFHWLRNRVWMKSISSYFLHVNNARSVKDDDHNVILDLAAGYLAGVIAVLVTGPLWLVNTRLKLQGVHHPKRCEDPTKKGSSDENCKIKMGGRTAKTAKDRVGCRSDNGIQSEKHSAINRKRKYHGIFQTLYMISREEGILSLWNGTSASVILSFNPAIQFGVYEMLKRQSGSDNSNTFANAVIAKFVATLVTYPMQVIQTQHRAGHHVARSNGGNLRLFHWIHDLWRIIREEGVISGLYCGFETKLVQGCLNSAVMFVVYERLVSFLSPWLAP
ncbi:hypothetical protein ACHAXS_006008 [Conticribra weissflogii]